MRIAEWGVEERFNVQGSIQLRIACLCVTARRQAECGMMGIIDGRK